MELEVSALSVVDMVAKQFAYDIGLCCSYVDGDAAPGSAGTYSEAAA